MITLVALSLASVYVPVGVSRVFPDEGTTLPTNARPVGFAQTGDTFDVVRVGDDAPLEVERLEGAVVIDPGPLAPGTSLSIGSSCPGCDPHVFTWQVGDGPDETPPAFADGGVANVFVLGFHSGGVFPVAAGYEVDLDLPPLDEPALVRLDGASGSFFADLCCGPGEGAATTHLHFFIDGGDERRECFDAVAVDVAGNETPFDEPLCFELTHDLLEEPVACASSGAPAGPLALALALVAARRRTRESDRSSRVRAGAAR